MRFVVLDKDTDACTNSVNCANGLNRERPYS